MGNAIRYDQGGHISAAIERCGCNDLGILVNGVAAFLIICCGDQHIIRIAGISQIIAVAILCVLQIGTIVKRRTAHTDDIVGYGDGGHGFTRVKGQACNHLGVLVDRVFAAFGAGSRD